MDLADPLFVVRDTKYVLEDLLKSRRRCAAAIEAETRRSFSAPTEGSHPCAYLKGAEAALVLLDRKIGLAMNQSKDAKKFMQAANKMVLTTTNLYGHQHQHQHQPQNQNV